MKVSTTTFNKVKLGNARTRNVIAKTRATNKAQVNTIRAKGKAQRSMVKAQSKAARSKELQRTARSLGAQTAASAGIESISSSQAKIEESRAARQRSAEQEAMYKYNNIISGNPDQQGSSQEGSTTTMKGSSANFGYGG